MAHSKWWWYDGGHRTMCEQATEQRVKGEPLAKYCDVMISDKEWTNDEKKKQHGQRETEI